MPPELMYTLYSSSTMTVMHTDLVIALFIIISKYSKY